MLNSEMYKKMFTGKTDYSITLKNRHSLQPNQQYDGTCERFLILMAENGGISEVSATNCGEENIMLLGMSLIQLLARETPESRSILVQLFHVITKDYLEGAI